MIDAMKLVKALTSGDFGVWEKAVEDAQAQMTPEEKKVYFSFTYCDMSKNFKRQLGIARRPIPATPFEIVCHDRELLHAYRICLAARWLEGKDNDPEGEMAELKAFDDMISAGLVKSDTPDVIDLTKEG